MFVRVFLCEIYRISEKKTLKPKKASFQLRINTVIPLCKKEILEKTNKKKKHLSSEIRIIIAIL